MERPVMEVTMTDSRMMIQVRTVAGEGGNAVTQTLRRGIPQVKEPRENPRVSPLVGHVTEITSLLWASAYSSGKWLSAYLPGPSGGH